MCGLSVAAGIIGQATLPSPIVEGYEFPAVRLDDGSYLKTVLNDREKMTVTLVNGDPNEYGELDIPENISIDGYGDFTITKIGEGTFSNRDDITAVQLPNTVESTNGSFYGGPNLEYVAFPEAVYAQISPDAFKNADFQIGTEMQGLHDWVKEEKSKS